jgi:hypothetical protein
VETNFYPFHEHGSARESLPAATGETSDLLRCAAAHGACSRIHAAEST